MFQDQLHLWQRFTWYAPLVSPKHPTNFFSAYPTQPLAFLFLSFPKRLLIHAHFTSFFLQVWVALLSAWLGEIKGPEDCQGVGAYYIAVGGLLAAFSLSCVLEIAAALVGCRGSIFETKKRAALPRIIYANALCILAQIGFNAYASVLITRRPPRCSGAGGKLWDPVEVLQGLVISTWTVIIGLIGLVVAVYNLFPDYKDPQEWERQCECLALSCLCLGQRSREAMQSAGSKRLGALFAIMFSHIDLTPTDIVASFGLALNRQRLRRRAIWEALTKSKRKKNELPGIVLGDAAGVAEAVHGDDEDQDLDRDGSPCSIDGLLDNAMELGEVEVELSSNIDALQSSTLRNSSSNKSTREPASRGQLRNTSSRDSSRYINGFLTGHDDASTSTGGGATTSTGMSHSASEDRIVGQAGLSSANLLSKGLGGGAGIGERERNATSRSESGGRLPSRSSSIGDGTRKRPLELGPADAETLAEAAHYMKYAFAAYGWKLFVWEKKTVGVARLCFGRSCGMWTAIASQRHGLPLLNSSQAPYFNREAILQAAELAEEDLLDVRLEGHAPNVLPYCLAVDHAKRTIVLAIRGSMSMDDVVRDLLFEPASLDDWISGQSPNNSSGIVSGSGNGPGSSTSVGRSSSSPLWEAPLPPLRPASANTRYAAHSGIFEATRATLEDLQQAGVLARALLGPAPRYPDYSLVVCGHSLGAGCAFLLSLRLRQFFPNLRCLAFSPPGGLATAELCIGAAEWCTSVVCGKEMIPRLTLTTFERTRDEIVYCAARCRRSKVSLMLGWLTGRIWKDEELFYRPEDLPDEPQAWLESYRESLAATAARREYVKLAGQFGPPGRVLYLKPTGRKAVSKNPGVGWLGLGNTVVRDYRGVWADGEVLIDQGLVLSGRMMLDHFPDYCLAVLRRLAAAGGGGQAAHVSDAAGRAEVHNSLHFDE